MNNISLRSDVSKKKCDKQMFQMYNCYLKDTKEQQGALPKLNSLNIHIHRHTRLSNM